MDKKTNQVYVGITLGILLVLAIAGVVMYFTYVEDKETSVNLKAYYIDENGNLVPLQGGDEGVTYSIVTESGGDPLIRSSIILLAAIQAGSGENQANVHISEITAQNSPGVNVYQPAIEGVYTLPMTLNPGQLDETYSSTIDITQVELGDVSFTLRIQGYYLDARGQQQILDVTSEPYTISILPEYNTKFRTNDLGYGSNSEVAYDSSCSGTMVRYETLGGISGVSCTSYLDTIIIDSPALPCSKSNCKFGIRGADYYVLWDSIPNCDGKKYTLGGSLVSTEPLFGFLTDYIGKEVSCGGVSCICGDWIWVDDACNAGGCVNQMHQIGTRVCIPGGCLSESGSRCVTDASCVSGGETCSDGIMNQDEICIDIGGVCGGYEAGTELSCSDGRDNDCDTLVDDADSDCQSLLTVIFRTNVIGEDYFDDWDKWIALDWDDSQGGYILSTLIGYGSRTKTSSGTSSVCTVTQQCPSTENCIIGYTPSGLKVIDYGSSTKVSVCVNPSDNRVQAFYEKGDFDASDAELSTSPVEPYTSNGQEVTS